MKNSFFSTIKRLFGIKKPILSLASAGKTIVIPYCDGSELLRDAEDTFDYCNRARCLAADNPFTASQEAEVGVYTLSQPCEAMKIFDFIAENKETLCFTEHQIIAFCKTQPEWFGNSEQDCALFLYKSPYFNSPYLPIKEKFHLAVIKGMHYSEKLSLDIQYLNEYTGLIGINYDLNLPNPKVYVVVPK